DVGDGGEPGTTRGRDRPYRHAAHLGAELDTEPSLMMRVISISFVFIKQFRLVFRIIPSQNQLTGSSEALNDGTDRLGLEVGTSNLPGCSRYNLFAFEKPG